MLKRPKLTNEQNFLHSWRSRHVFNVGHLMKGCDSFFKRHRPPRMLAKEVFVEFITAKEKSRFAKEWRKVLAKDHVIRIESHEVFNTAQLDWIYWTLDGPGIRNHMARRLARTGNRGVGWMHFWNLKWTSGETRHFSIHILMIFTRFMDFLSLASRPSSLAGWQVYHELLCYWRTGD